MHAPHSLDPLLRPRSIAIMGATQREDSVGNQVLKNLITGAYPGELFAVNPRYQNIEGIRCYPSLKDLPSRVEHVIFAVSDARIEKAIDEAINHGARAGTIFSLLTLNNDTKPDLRSRITHKISEARMLLCGANSMGFYHFTEDIWVCGFDTRLHKKPGNVCLISQSGSGMCGILDVDERINFNLAVSTGQELTVTMEDYLDFAVEQEETRVIGLFMESSRQPEQFISALEKACERKIPVVAVKVGRTRLAADLAVSHSGAMAGNDAVYDAIFERYGVQRVDDMDQLATALIMFAQAFQAGAGGVVTIHDSGGEQQLLIDMAENLHVPLAVITDETKSSLEALLDPGLQAINPLDAWGSGGEDNHKRIGECFSVLLKDENAALGAVVHDRAPYGEIYGDYYDYLRKGRASTDKPIFLVSNRQGTGADKKVIDLTLEGFPVLDGIQAFLKGAKCMLAYRDFTIRPAMNAPELEESKVMKWRTILMNKSRLNEHEAGQLLNDCYIPVESSWLINNKQELLALTSQLDYPVVMKTASDEVQHKSEVDGVVLDIEDKSALLTAYEKISKRLGQKVVISPMNNAFGIEMILGFSCDEQFGPVVIMGMGGIYTEMINDTVVIAPPFDAETARLALNKLTMRKLLDGYRGNPAVDVQAYCEAAACLSVMAIEFKEEILEVDINPIKVMKQGCKGLDALVVIYP